MQHAESARGELRPDLRPGISVVVPCHDYGRYLPEALASIEAQSRKPDEIVVVDDGSTDDTASVIASFTTRHPATRVVTRFPAKGAVETFNDGVRGSSCHLVVILSADDTMSHDYLERLAEALDSTEADFAYATVRFIGNREGTWTARPFDRRRIARANYVNASSMFRRELFDAVGGFDSAFGPLGMEDWAFWIAAVGLGARGIAVPECSLGYRRHPEGSRNDMAWWRVVAVHREMRRRWPEVVGRTDLVVGIALDTRVWLVRALRHRQIGCRR